jgi:hypothetical protein
MRAKYLRVQFYDPRSAHLTGKLPGPVCRECGDVVIGADLTAGRCPCCVQLKRPRPQRVSVR